MKKGLVVNKHITFFKIIKNKIKKQMLLDSKFRVNHMILIHYIINKIK